MGKMEIGQSLWLAKYKQHKMAVGKVMLKYAQSCIAQLVYGTSYHKPRGHGFNS